MPDFGIRTDIVPDQETRVTITPDKAGSFAFFCDIFCGDGHEDMERHPGGRGLSDYFVANRGCRAGSMGPLSEEPCAFAHRRDAWRRPTDFIVASACRPRSRRSRADRRPVSGARHPGMGRIEARRRLGLAQPGARLRGSAGSVCGIRDRPHGPGAEGIASARAASYCRGAGLAAGASSCFTWPPSRACSAPRRPIRDRPSARTCRRAGSP